jgi:hypothetical protein
MAGELDAVIALHHDGVLATLRGRQRGGMSRQRRKESTKTNQQPLHNIL